mmetsp:Transcript_38793/g.94193  ORF Transcript_38793/g.94193 Transcript_38793/m.94193 type:complete len:288 (-) Transcript_38793:210-1073(-)
MATAFSLYSPPQGFSPCCGIQWPCPRTPCPRAVDTKTWPVVAKSECPPHNFDVPNAFAAAPASAPLPIVPFTRRPGPSRAGPSIGGPALAGSVGTDPTAALLKAPTGETVAAVGPGALPSSKRRICERTMKFGMSILFSSRSPVNGDVSWSRSQNSMAWRSNVCPSIVHTGSCMSSWVMGQKNSGAAISSSAASSALPMAAWSATTGCSTPPRVGAGFEGGGSPSTGDHPSSCCVVLQMAHRPQCAVHSLHTVCPHSKRRPSLSASPHTGQLPRKAPFDETVVWPLI